MNLKFADYALPSRTILRCSEFEDILSPWDVYCLIALTAYHSGHMGVCSRYEFVFCFSCTLNRLSSTTSIKLSEKRPVTFVTYQNHADANVLQHHGPQKSFGRPIVPACSVRDKQSK